MRRIVFKRVGRGKQASWDFVGESERGTDEGALEELQHQFDGGERVLVLAPTQVKPSAIEYKIDKTFKVKRV